MFLVPHELEKLTLHNVGLLAQRRLARGVRLNHPEAVALIATVTLELIRDGRHSVAQLMEVGRTLLGVRQVMPGVPELIPDVQVEGTFPDGTKLVSVHHPIHRTDGNLTLALHGSFLPVPDLSVFTATDTPAPAPAPAPGCLIPAADDITINADRPAISLVVTNTGERPIQVGSHYPFIETNRPLKFDRAASYGKRLDIPAGTAIRFEPGETKTVRLVDIDGHKIIKGANRLASGEVSDLNLKRAMQKIHAENYANTEGH